MQEKLFDISKKVQRHLYDHPFYNWTGSMDTAMQILVVGDSLYARSFVDLSLQTGQMLDKPLIIYWGIENPERKREYLEQRPALRDFVDIDTDALHRSSDAYATLLFKNVSEILDSFCETCRYIFVATEDDAYNQETAELFKQAVREDCLAAYIKNNTIEVSFNGNPDAPEYQESNEAGERIASYDELERMAFNTHRVWEGSGNLDYEKAKERFYDPYNYHSSVAFVLSIPYKLKSVGINETNPYKAAERLDTILGRAKKDPNCFEAGILSKLALLEHRRWVLEKVTEGAVRLLDKTGAPNYSMCIANASVKKKDAFGRLLAHPCIVKSTEDTPLVNGAFADRSKWDDSSVALDALDDLDRMSIDMHRTMLRGAKQLKNHRQILTASLDSLRSLCESDMRAKRDFDRYYFCIENIIDSSKAYAAQFETYEKMLRKSIDELSDSEKSLADELISQIGTLLFPILESNQYRDYKSYDAELIRHIPFILTGKRDISLCLPLGEASSIRGNNEDFFRSVASATALYAEKITYLYVYEYTTNLNIFASKLKAIRNYLDYRGKACDIQIKFFLDNKSADDDLKDKIEKCLIRAKESGHIQDYAVIGYEDVSELQNKVMDSLQETKIDYFDGTNPFTRSARINGELVEALSNRYPYFEFDSYNKSFVNCKECEYLRYARLSSFIQVEDMFALMNAQDKEFNYQDYADSYRDYWDIYSGNVIHVSDFPLCARSWTKVSSILKSGGANCLHISGREMGASDSREIDTIKKMLRALEQKQFLCNLSISSDNKVTVNIADKKVKGMFLKAGDLLETYVYFEACKTGWFDDVQTGYKFKWEYDDVTNELDCVLTKDYRSILVECKSTKDAEEGFYLTLDSLADHFGIGYKKVLIMVTDTNNISYNNYVSRGKQMDIITISRKSDLENIGRKLIEIMKM